MVKAGVESVKEDPPRGVQHSSTEETVDDAEAIEVEAETVEAKVDCTGGCFLQNDAMISDTHLVEELVARIALRRL
jgi:hypothetical protein